MSVIVQKSEMGQFVAVVSSVRTLSSLSIAVSVDAPTRNDVLGANSENDQTSTNHFLGNL